MRATSSGATPPRQLVTLTKCTGSSAWRTCSSEIRQLSSNDLLCRRLEDLDLRFPRRQALPHRLEDERLHDIVRGPIIKAVAAHQFVGQLRGGRVARPRPSKHLVLVHLDGGQQNKPRLGIGPRIVESGQSAVFHVMFQRVGVAVWHLHAHRRNFGQVPQDLRGAEPGRLDLALIGPLCPFLGHHEAAHPDLEIDEVVLVGRPDVEVPRHAAEHGDDVDKLGHHHDEAVG